MSDESALPAKLCYAPAAEIPHPPHGWYESDLADAAAHPDGPIKVHAWYCDGWAAITPGFVSGLSADSPRSGRQPNRKDSSEMSRSVNLHAIPYRVADDALAKEVAAHAHFKRAGS